MRRPKIDKYLIVFIGVEIVLVTAFIFRDEIWRNTRIPALMTRNERLIRRFLGDWVYEAYIEVTLVATIAFFLSIIVGLVRQNRKRRRLKGSE
ncbi:hypothetical protein [Aquamicrobium sp. LC103]|uniref:hypothetical protein n=1 Tax=Aquamicrobium sp. LC103 TaxID=1120658 RepID=UPI00063ED0E0|nr:hypothetical protein [Aquamicrobium sp. LC103]TKT76335.1 hypothetical protein XW59_017355 [Aquamicrobium sp. LC103]